MHIAVLPGDGIGPDVITQAVKVLQAMARAGVKLEFEQAPVGGAGYDTGGDPLPEATLALAKAADAVLLGAVGGHQYEALPREQRPERGLLRLRQELGVFSNLRPVRLHAELVACSPLKPEVIAGLDLMIVRELIGDVYFGEPRGIRQNAKGEREGFDTMLYSEGEIRRIADAGFKIAEQRGKKLCSVDKANVLETSRLWREIVTEVGRDYPAVQLTHMYVDNAAMQLVRNPRQFDVMLTGNLFGDILSDQAAMLTGSIGMLPSASLDQSNKGLYEPIHGSAPDIAGKDLANPLATILSVAMMMRYTFARPDLAASIEAAVDKVLAQTYRTPDIFERGARKVGTEEMGDAVVASLRFN